jgi:hypothetical protein
MSENRLWGLEKGTHPQDSSRVPPAARPSFPPSGGVRFREARLACGSVSHATRRVQSSASGGIPGLDLRLIDRRHRAAVGSFLSVQSRDHHRSSGDWSQFGLRPCLTMRANQPAPRAQARPSTPGSTAPCEKPMAAAMTPMAAQSTKNSHAATLNSSRSAPVLGAAAPPGSVVRRLLWYLVPALALANPRAQLPAARLRHVLGGGLQRVELGPRVEPAAGDGAR